MDDVQNLSKPDRQEPGPTTQVRPRALPWPMLAMLLAGLLALYAPVFLEMARTYWTTDDEAHGPLIVMVCLYFAWTKRDEFRVAAASSAPSRVAGSAGFVLALLMHMFGTSQDILILVLGALPLLLGSLIVLTAGWSALRVMAFPLCFLVFMFPIPPSILDALTQPLKNWVSWATDQILYRAGYPIARQGVILAIGQYQLLVADACSGMRSLISLSALGVLFIYITARSSRLHIALMLSSIIPLALFANLVRVIALVLITFYLGDEAGQGYLHGTAGMVMFMVAMLGLIAWDSILASVLPKPRSRPEPLKR